MKYKQSYVLAILLGLGSFLLHKGGFMAASLLSPAFRVKELLISGQALVPSLPLLEGLKGQPLREIDLKEIKAQLLEHPLIADAVLRKEYPSTVQVLLKERRPAAEVHSGQVVYVVDASARALPLAAKGKVVQIYADFGVALNGPQIIDEEIVAALSVLNEVKGHEVAALSLSRNKGLAFTLKNLATSFSLGNQPLAEHHLERALRIAASITEKNARIPKTVDLSAGGDTVVGYF